MLHPYPVVNVTHWEVTGVQADGLNEHPWLREPVSRELWLFKLATEHRGAVRGEDWAEKITSEVAANLGVPCAEVRLASNGPQRGSLSKDLCPRGWEMQPGALLLSDTFPDYEPGLRGAAGHSLDAIEQALRAVGAPPLSSPLEFGAFDVFAGFLVLDCLVANRDRHEQNWSVLRPPAGTRDRDALCGAYDHGSSLGFNLSDEQRSRILEKSLSTWVERGTAWRFEHGDNERPTTLTEVARRALDRCESTAKQHWMTAVTRLDRTTVSDLVHRVPGLSATTATFITELIAINRRRLLDA